MFQALGSFCYRRRWLVLVTVGVLLLGAVALLVRGGTLTGGSIRELESERAERFAEDVLGHSREMEFVAVFQAKQALSESELRSAVSKAVAPLRRHPAVQSLIAPEDVPSGPGVPQMVNAPARSALAVVTLAGTPKAALKAYPDVRRTLDSDALTITATGRIPFLHDLGVTLAHDLSRAELLSLPLALLVLLFVFRTAVAAVLPVGVGALAVLGGISLVMALSHHMDIAEYTVSVCSLIGLGVAIDYALFMVSRYREELARGRSYEEALRKALDTAGRVVAFSGIAVCTGLSGLLFFEGSYLMSMGIGGAIVVGLAVVFALTFLPAVLAVLGPKINALALPIKPVARGEGFWHRTATWVMRRPVTVFLPTLLVLVCIGIPFFHLRMTASDVRVLPQAVEARDGYELLRQHFPEQTQNRLLVAVEFPTSPALTPERVGALYDLSRSIAKVPNVRKVESLFDMGVPLSREMYQHLLTAPAGAPPPGMLGAMLKPGAVPPGAPPSALPPGMSPSALPPGVSLESALPPGVLPSALPPGVLPSALPPGMAINGAIPSALPPGAPAPDAEGRSPLKAVANPAAFPPPQLLAGIEAVKQQTVGNRVVLLQALTDLAPDSEEARTLVKTLRKERTVADGALVIGGPSANDLDVTAYVLERAPRAIAFVVGITLVTLFFLLGSVLLPIKAVAMNFLSIIGSFGALVWVFQDGHLLVSHGRPLEPSLPVLLFCITFGLSMDYEVLMLSRIKESYEQSGDNSHAVADGLEKSAGLITSAALIMVTVFSAFTLARIVLIQAVGFGMAIAVALDATLVRVLLVPSTMRLLGDANWWAPKPLLALRRRLGLASMKHG